MKAFVSPFLSIFFFERSAHPEIIGKSTLANVLLRIFDYDTPSSSESDTEPELLINGLPIRQLDPAEYHSHVTALFQVFSKLNATVRENVGIGNVRDGFSDKAVEEAARRAGAGKLVHGLPRGLDTRLECMGLGLGGAGMGEALEPGEEGGEGGKASDARQGLSGGEVSNRPTLTSQIPFGFKF